MRMRVILGVVMIAAMLAPVGAHAADPVLTGGVVGPEWKAYKLTSDGTPVSLVFKLKIHREPQTVGRWVFNPDGTKRNGFQFRAIPIRTKLETHVEVTDGVEYDIDQQGDEYDWGVTITTGAEMPGTPENPKTYIVLLFTGGVASTPPTWTLTLPQDRVVLGDVTSGNKTYYLMPDDFDAPAKVSAEQTVAADPTVFPFGLGPGVHAVVDGRKVIDVEGVFLGAWSNTYINFSSSSSVYRSVVTNENSFQRDCSVGGCSWSHYWLPPESTAPFLRGLPPGRYTFEHTGAGAGAAEYSYLFGMDVTFPE